MAVSLSLSHTHTLFLSLSLSPSFFCMCVFFLWGLMRACVCATGRGLSLVPSPVSRVNNARMCVRVACGVWRVCVYERMDSCCACRNLQRYWRTCLAGSVCCTREATSQSSLEWDNPTLLNLSTYSGHLELNAYQCYPLWHRRVWLCT